MQQMRRSGEGAARARTSKAGGGGACTVLQHVEHALHREESVGLLLFAQAVKEDGQVMVVVQLLNLDLPADAVVNAAMLDLNGQVSALVEAAELRVGRVRTLLEGAAHRRSRCGALQLLALGKRRGHAAVARVALQRILRAAR